MVVDWKKNISGYKSLCVHVLAMMAINSGAGAGLNLRRFIIISLSASKYGRYDHCDSYIRRYTAVGHYISVDVS